MKLLLAMNFPEYVYHEYPKWVCLEDGKSVRADTAEEEAAILGNRPVEVATVSVATANALAPDVSLDLADKALLRVIAAKFGINADGRWSEKRLREEILKVKALV